MTKATRLKALEREGDMAFRNGEEEQVRRLYDQVRAGTVSESRLRTLDVKERSMSHPASHAAVAALLVGTTWQGPSNVEALDRIGIWRQ